MRRRARALAGAWAARGRDVVGAWSGAAAGEQQPGHVAGPVPPAPVAEARVVQRPADEPNCPSSLWRQAPVSVSSCVQPVMPSTRDVQRSADRFVAALSRYRLGIEAAMAGCCVKYTLTEAGSPFAAVVLSPQQRVLQVRAHSEGPQVRGSGHASSHRIVTFAEPAIRCRRACRLKVRQALIEEQPGAEFGPPVCSGLMRANSAGGGYVNQIERDKDHNRVRQAYGEAA
jgi:hypothetical protein